MGSNWDLTIDTATLLCALCELADQIIYRMASFLEGL